MHWSDKYIGLPYSDHNCAEFVAMVAFDHYNIDIVLPADMGKYLRTQQKKINKHLFEYVDAQKLDDPIDGAICLMHGRKRHCHIGITVIINKIPYVLHSMTGCNSVVRHRVIDLHKFNLKVEGFYQWLI